MTKSTNRDNSHAEKVVLDIENPFVAPWKDPHTPPDSSSRAKVRVAIMGGDPLKEYDLFFRFPVTKTAWFMLTETSNDRPTSLSSFKLKGGEITEIYVANSNSEETLLESWIEFGPTDNSDIEPGYCYFSVASGDGISGMIINNGAYGYEFQPITVKYTVKKGGKVQPNVSVSFDIFPPDKFTFTKDGNIHVGTDKNTATGFTDGQGQISVGFTCLKRNNGSIECNITDEIGLTDPSETLYFNFTDPDFKCDIYAIGTITDKTDGFVEWSEVNDENQILAYAPAGGAKSLLLIHAKVTLNGQPLTKLGGSVKFATMKGGEVFGGPADVLTTTKTVDVKNGEAQVPVYCKDIRNDIITASFIYEDIVTPGNAGIVFESVDPWVDVPYVAASFPNSNDMQRYIYANNNHVVGLTVTAAPTDYKGDELPKNFLPADIFAYSNLISWDDPEFNALGAGRFSKWSVSRNCNSPFTAPINSQRIAEQHQSSVDVEYKDKQSTTYYIQCSDRSPASDYRFGFEVKPTGQVITPADKKGRFTEYRMGDKKECDIVRCCSTGFPPASQTSDKVISAMLEIKYTTNDLDVVATAQSTTMQNDDGPFVNSGVDAVDNYWRRYSYKVTLNAKSNDYFIYQCRASNGTPFPTDWCVASSLNDGYSYKVYLWPVNFLDEGGKVISKEETFSINGINDRGKTVQISGNDRSLNFDWYANFAFSYPSGYTPVIRKISFQIYDQYGNNGTFTFDPGSMPKYKTDDLNKWKPINDGKAIDAPRDIVKMEEYIYREENEGQNIYIRDRRIAVYFKDTKLFLAAGERNKGDICNSELSNGAGEAARMSLKCYPSNASDYYPRDCIYVIVSDSRVTTNGLQLWQVMYGASNIINYDTGGNDDDYSGDIGIFVESPDDQYLDYCKSIISPVWSSQEFVIYNISKNGYFYANSDKQVARVGALNRSENVFRFSIY